MKKETLKDILGIAIMFSLFLAAGAVRMLVWM